MIIQLSLSLGLLGILGYVILQRDKVKVIFMPQLAVISVGIFLIWFPNVSTFIAKKVGVGRGADLITYCWIVASILLIVNLQIKLKKLEAHITKLTRAIALVQPKNGHHGNNFATKKD